MSYEYKSRLRTKYNPSVIEYSPAHQLFVCGTYQLFDDQSVDTIDETLAATLKTVNNRFGNLLLITRDNVLAEEYECADGGVFDLKLTEWDEWLDCPVVAHANGSVTVYGIDSSQRLQSLRRYATNSSLLTCLTVTHFGYTIVGDSDGKLVFVDTSSESTAQLSVTKHCEPIWSVFCAQIGDNYALFVGSDDSRWRVYCLPHSVSMSSGVELLSQLMPKYVNTDSDAGITSFTTNKCSDNVLSLIVGSYDEFIRYYCLEFVSNDSEMKVCLKHKLHIDGSGIWRIVVRHGFESMQLVSGMYSGAHLVVDSKLDQTLVPPESTPDDKHLIYGVNCDLQLNHILMASFYGQTLYLFSKS